MKNTRYIPVLAALALGITSSHAAITLVNTGFAATNGSGQSGTLTRDVATYTYSYDAGASFDMLVVTVSREGGGGLSVTYANVGMNSATPTAGSTGVSIYYLNTTASSGDIVLNFGGGSNGVGIGIAAIKSDNGDPIAVFDADFGTGTSISIDTADDSFTMWAIDTNLGPFDDLPAVQINKNTDVGSNGYAAAYKLVTTGSVGDTYSYNFTGTTGTQAARGIAAANFVVVPEPSAALLGALGALCLLRRRR
ncbi:hypothetical protein HZ994_06705 [Akkermansiaceae bacterium]|nr:hypothetical protein HZ994_06705 [Akkermansiaceae bacterium]